MLADLLLPERSSPSSQGSKSPFLRQLKLALSPELLADLFFLKTTAPFCVISSSLKCPMRSHELSRREADLAFFSPPHSDEKRNSRLKGQTSVKGSNSCRVLIGASFSVTTYREPPPPNFSPFG